MKENRTNLVRQPFVWMILGGSALLAVAGAAYFASFNIYLSFALSLLCLTVYVGVLLLSRKLRQPQGRIAAGLMAAYAILWLLKSLVHLTMLAVWFSGRLEVLRETFDIAAFDRESFRWCVVVGIKIMVVLIFLLKRKVQKIGAGLIVLSHLVSLVLNANIVISPLYEMVNNVAAYNTVVGLLADILQLVGWWFVIFGGPKSDDKGAAAR